MKLVCIYFIGLGLVNIEFLFDSEAEELNNGVMLIGVLMEFNFQTLFFFFGENVVLERCSSSS